MLEINECEATVNEVLILANVWGLILCGNISTEVRTYKEDPRLNLLQDQALSSSGSHRMGTGMLGGQVMRPRPCSTAVAEERVGLQGASLTPPPKIAAQGQQVVYKQLKTPILL